MKKYTALLRGVAIFAAIVIAGLVLGCTPKEEPTTNATPKQDALVREHSPVVGPTEAAVTIVEFFDPSCEACRAFYPFTKQILAEYPNDVRLVLRYVPFHRGSDVAIGILESARMQGVYEPVLEAVLAAQPEWHDDPELKAAWQAAEAAGLNVEKAREQMQAPEIAANLKQDIADAKTHDVTATPTFFVNGQPLEPFGPETLVQLVKAEVAKARQ